MRVAYPRDKYLNRQRVAFMLAQEQVFPDKRDLRKALGCTPTMMRNYAMALVPFPDVLLFNLMGDSPEMAEFARVYESNFWGIGG